MNRPKTITNEQSDTLKYWLNGRYKTVFDLAVQSGFRISDILALKVKDVRGNPMSVYEKKSKRKRTVKVSEELHRRLINLTYAKSDSDFVFDSDYKTGVSVHRSTIHRQIKKALREASEGFDASSHSARKLYARNIYEATGSAYSVQRALNHQKLSTTLTYLDLAQQDSPERTKSATEHRKRNLFRRAMDFIKGFFSSNR